MNYSRLSKDLFQSANFSRNELNLFTVDFISKVKGKKIDGFSEDEVTALVAAHNEFVGNYGNLASKSAKQKGKTISRQEARNNIIDFIKQKEGLIKSTFKKGSAVYTEFYPQGVSEYHSATVEGIKVLLIRYSDAAQKYENELGKDFVNTLLELQTSYVNARDNQVSDKAENKNTEVALKKSRKALTVQLTKCVLLIAANTIGKEAEFLSYFNFGLLEADNPNHKYKSALII
jgi:hypothetical protein